MRKTRAGFTMIELIVIMFVIAILVTISVTTITKTRISAMDKGALTDFHMFRETLNHFVQDNAGFGSVSTDEVLLRKLNKYLSPEAQIQEYEPPDTYTYGGPTEINPYGVYSATNSTNNGVFRSELKDPWGNNYFLRVQRYRGTRVVILIKSAGPDGLINTDSDRLGIYIYDGGMGKLGVLNLTGYNTGFTNQGTLDQTVNIFTVEPRDLDGDSSNTELYRSMQVNK